MYFKARNFREKSLQKCIRECKFHKYVRTYQRRTCARDHKISFTEVNFANPPKLCENFKSRTIIYVLYERYIQTSLKSPRLSTECCFEWEVWSDVTDADADAAAAASRVRSSCETDPLRKMVVDGAALGLYLLFFILFAFNAFMSLRNGVGKRTSYGDNGFVISWQPNYKVN